jgi:hypothetical protein
MRSGPQARNDLSIHRSQASSYTRSAHIHNGAAAAMAIHHQDQAFVLGCQLRGLGRAGLRERGHGAHGVATCAGGGSQRFDDWEVGACLQAIRAAGPKRPVDRAPTPDQLDTTTRGAATVMAVHQPTCGRIDMSATPTRTGSSSAKRGIAPEWLHAQMVGASGSMTGR